MKYLVVEFNTVTATFRNPEFQNFHKTLQLPPPTTLVGLAGAALGISPKGAQEWFELGEWQLGIYGSSAGYAKDLWKYRTLSSDPEKASSVLHREILFGNHYLIVFGSKDEDRVDKLSEAFYFPKYALTFGSSDSLAKVVSVTTTTQLESSRHVINCFTSGNVLNEIQDNLFNGEEFSIYSSSEPIAYDLPVLFQYESDYGARRVVRRKTLSFIGTPMQLNYSVEGIRYKGNFVPVFPLHDAVT